MPYYDLDQESLRAYRPSLPEPPDAREFWTSAVDALRQTSPEATFEPVDSGLATIATYDVWFRGADGDRIAGWLHLPADAVPGAGPRPAVVQFQGYGGGRGLAQEDFFWAAAGYAHLVVDTRGQGSGWSTGATADPSGSLPAQPGFVTKGIADRSTYYYRRVFLDGVAAVSAVRAHPSVDPQRVVVAGGSQGGAIALATAALVPDVMAVMPDVPFLSNVRRGVELAQEEPYLELVRYLAAHSDQVEAVFETLSYFDVALLARWATAPALFSVAYMDRVCPPSTVYAAYNAYGGSDKQIVEYPFNDHEGGRMFHKVRQLRWLADLIGVEAADA